MLLLCGCPSARPLTSVSLFSIVIRGIWAANRVKEVQIVVGEAAYSSDLSIVETGPAFWASVNRAFISSSVHLCCWERLFNCCILRSSICSWGICQEIASAQIVCCAFPDPVLCRLWVQHQLWTFEENRTCYKRSVCSEMLKLTQMVDAQLLRSQDSGEEWQ